MTSLHFCLEIMSLCNIVNSVNKIKRLFRKYGASNVNETFLFDVSILLLLFEHSVCAVYFACICFNISCFYVLQN